MDERHDGDGQLVQRTVSRSKNASDSSRASTTLITSHSIFGFSFNLELCVSYNDDNIESENSCFVFPQTTSIHLTTTSADEKNENMNSFRKKRLLETNDILNESSDEVSHLQNISNECSRDIRTRKKSRDFGQLLE